MNKTSQSKYIILHKIYTILYKNYFFIILFDNNYFEKFVAETGQTLKYVSLVTLTLQNALVGLSMRYSRTRAGDMFLSSTGKHHQLYYTLLYFIIILYLLYYILRVVIIKIFLYLFICPF